MKKEDITYFEITVKKSDTSALSSVLNKINKFAFAKRDIPYALILKLHKIVENKSNIDFEIAKIDIEQRALIAYEYLSKQKEYDFIFAKKSSQIPDFIPPNVKKEDANVIDKTYSLKDMLLKSMWHFNDNSFATKDEAIIHAYSYVVDYIKDVPNKKVKHLTKYKLAVIAAYITISNGVKILDTSTGKITNQRLFQAARPAISKYEKSISKG